MRGLIAKNVMITIGDYQRGNVRDYINIQASRLCMNCFGCKLKGASDEND